MLGSRRYLFIVAGVIALLPATARAAELRWNAPSDCDFEATVREDAERLLGAPLESVASVDFEVEVSAEDATSWKLRLSTVEREGGARRVRELAGASCAEVANAASIAIAMAARKPEPGAPTEEPDARSDAAPVPAPVQPAPATVPTPPPGPSFIDDSAIGRAEAKRRAGPRFGFGAGVIVDSGALPTLAPGLELEAAFHFRGLRLAAVGALFASQHAELASGAGGDFRLIVVGALACWEHRSRRSWSFAACGGYETGTLEGEGTGIVRSRLGSYLWQAGRADVGVGYELTHRTHFEVRLGGAVPFARREFVLNEDEVVHRPDGLSGRGYAGLELEL